MATFTRASKATYINKQGVLVEAGIDEPRFEKEGILIEGESTNHVLQSNDLLNSPHSGPLGSFVKEPDGFYKWTQSFSVGTDYYAIRIKLSKDLTGTFSCLVDAGNWKSFGMFCDGPVGESLLGTNCAVFDMSVSETTPTYKGDSAFVDSVNLKHLYGSTYRLSFVSKGDIDRFEIKMFPRNYVGGSSRIASSDGNYIRIGFPQVEELPFASSYIPTNGTPVTRAEDRLSFSTEGVLTQNMTVILQAKAFGSTVVTRLWYAGVHVRGGEAYWGVDTRNTTLNTDSGGVVEGGSYCVTIDKPNMNLYYNGKLEASTNAMQEPIVVEDTCHIGGTSSFLYGKLYGHVKNFRIWNHALTAEQIATL